MSKSRCEKVAVRVEAWVKEAVAGDARLLTGGRRQGAVYEPAIVADVKPEMRISRDELLGPAVAVTRSPTSTRPSRWPTTPTTAWPRRHLHREPGDRNGGSRARSRQATSTSTGPQ